MAQRSLAKSGPQSGGRGQKKCDPQKWMCKGRPFIGTWWFSRHHIVYYIVFNSFHMLLYLSLYLLLIILFCRRLTVVGSCRMPCTQVMRSFRNGRTAAQIKADRELLRKARESLRCGRWKVDVFSVKPIPRPKTGCIEDLCFGDLVNFADEMPSEFTSRLTAKMTFA